MATQEKGSFTLLLFFGGHCSVKNLFFGMEALRYLLNLPFVSEQMLHEWGGGVEVEQLCLQGRPWQYRGEGNANIVLALQDVSQ